MSYSTVTSHQGRMIRPANGGVLAEDVGSKRLSARFRPCHILGEMAHLGVIENRRGSIVVLDRAPLEKVTCECYAAIREIFKDLGRRQDKLRNED